MERLSGARVVYEPDGCSVDRDGADEGGAVGLGDDGGHGEGLAGAGDAEKDLIFFAGGEAREELGDGAGLVALGLVGVNRLSVWRSPRVFSELAGVQARG
jgi:hypothetical protein